MTGSSVSGVSDTTVGSLLSDESALERLFRSHFSALCEEARGHLGEVAGASAPRVVEVAFRQAWEDRAHITTDAELKSYLHEAVRGAAARELSRRTAAHRLGGAASGGAHHAAATADVDQSWAHLQRLLHPEAGRQEQQVLSEKLRHEAAAHVGDLSKPRSWKVPVLIFVIGAAVVLGGMWYVTTLGADRAVGRALDSNEARSLAAASGQTGLVTLDDSTKVTLAPGSKLTIPKLFGDELRAVKLEGAARFVVAPGHPKPFEVRAGDAAVLVAGTTLTVRAFANDPVVTVHVRDGEATIRLGKELHPLTAGRALSIESGGRVRDPSPAELALATNWTDRRVTMTNRQLRDVIQEINRWYGLEIKVPELKVLDRMASVDAPLDSLRVAIGQVEKSADVAFGYEGQTMVFRSNKAPEEKNKR